MLQLNSHLLSLFCLPRQLHATDDADDAITLINRQWPSTLTQLLKGLDSRSWAESDHPNSRDRERSSYFLRKCEQGEPYSRWRTEWLSQSFYSIPVNCQFLKLSQNQLPEGHLWVQNNSGKKKSYVLKRSSYHSKSPEIVLDLMT